MSLKPVPLVSVVLPFRNPGKDLLNSVQSILWQSFTDWELILLDDGSTDPATQCLKGIRDERIRLIPHRKSAGLPTMLNEGIRLAQGRYLARMDADDVAFPERLERQVGYLERNRSVDLLATAALVIDRSNVPLGLMAAGLSHREICQKPYHGFPMPHPTWMGRTDWFRKHGYAKSAVRCEDQVLLLQSFHTSCLAGLSEALLGYRFHGISPKNTIRGRYHYLCALAKERRWQWLMQGFLVHMLAAGRDLVAFQGRWDRRAIKWKTTPLNPESVKEWNKILTRLEDKNAPAETNCNLEASRSGLGQR